MKSKRILIPVDVEEAERSFGILQFIEGMAGGPAIDATLLYVVNVNITLPERRVFDELCAEGEKQLRGLARLFLDHCSGLRVHVRVGRPHEEIVAEAESELSELIVMLRPKPSPWPWPFRSGTVEHVVRAAPCLTLVLPRIWKTAGDQCFRANRPRQAASDSASLMNSAAAF